MRYRGRFAPSPTGPLHFGSLVTALASYLDARANGGTWLVRIEDLDPLRDSPAAAHQILETLQHHRLIPDEPVRYQSGREDLYHQRLQELIELGVAYPCACSRKELRDNGGRHPRQCRQAGRQQGAPEQKTPAAIRFALSDNDWYWDDLLLGPQERHTAAEIDDFVLQRKEGFFAYQLAVVADDIDQKITHVVRGSDLLDSTSFQLALYRSLSTAPPAFMHLPVITDEAGDKLSKQTHAPPLENDRASANLDAAFSALHHVLPRTLRRASPDAQLEWGRSHWSRGRVPASLAIKHAPPEG